ncbi:anti-sigma regulatory factor [Actimicrobium sp. CCC2.4]|uniref:anti-sigma regulatory factor n=1 Tax=Actimicrobium sp. CCC2.4 TaxID=3048606 RepID=UPI002AC929D7|nr:anti-sigma regulatory factor [Actimicrobium sp. CCC2.4]MEB0133727.1 anti-sigma regulatory factor [Actimicrobium sp. CCC2.4]WPX31274.1 anti-sigma regulatory factor [Actimicrobium sp. CCC2.4]
MTSLSEPDAVVDICTTADIVVARRLTRQLAACLDFGSADQTRLATAVSELTRNVIEYAGRGTCHISDASDAGFNSIMVVVEDHGPGIANVAQAMQDGYSTSGSLGAGLPGTRRLVDSFMIESRPGLTRVTISMSMRKDRP